MEGIIFVAITILLVGGLCYFLLNSLPLDIGPMKAWGLWVIVAIVAIAMVFKVVIPLLHSVV